jgi:hypothetical protein
VPCRKAKPINPTRAMRARSGTTNLALRSPAKPPQWAASFIIARSAKSPRDRHSRDRDQRFCNLLPLRYPVRRRPYIFPIVDGLLHYQDVTCQLRWLQIETDRCSGKRGTLLFLAYVIFKCSTFRIAGRTFDASSASVDDRHVFCLPKYYS